MKRLMIYLVIIGAGACITSVGYAVPPSKTELDAVLLDCPDHGLQVNHMFVDEIRILEDLQVPSIESVLNVYLVKARNVVQELAAVLPAENYLVDPGRSYSPSPDVPNYRISKRCLRNYQPGYRRLC